MDSIILIKPSIEYLRHMTTRLGMLQHANRSKPNPRLHYALDDNARALLAVCMWQLCEGEKLGNLEETYLKFIAYSQDPSGEFYCYITQKKEKKEKGTGDFFGRALMAASFVYHMDNNSLAHAILEKSMHILPKNGYSLRTISFLLFAAYYSKDKKVWEKMLPSWACQYKMALRNCQKEKWYWPEEKITYDNGKIIQGYFLLGKLLESDEFIQIGITMLEFYLEKVFSRGYFQIPGNRGFITPSNFTAFDEQALEVYSLIAALTSAHIITGKASYIHHAHSAYGWFWGKNRLKIPMVDPITGGVHDGLGEVTANNNEGSESYLSLLLSYLLLRRLTHL